MASKFHIINGGSIADTSNNEILVFGDVADAKNEIKITNAGAGSGPIIAVQSTSATDSNIDLNLHAKGTGVVKLTTNSANNEPRTLAFDFDGSSADADTIFLINSTSDRTITFPDATDTLVGLAATQTLTNKTLTSPTLTSAVLTTPQINDTSADHQYVFAVSELTADRTVTLPLLTDNDEFTFNSHIQTLTNKTLTTPYVTTSINPSTSGGASLGTTLYEWSNLYLANGGIIYLGNDNDVTLTHVLDTGLKLTATTAATTGTKKLLDIIHQTSGTPSIGIGTDIGFSVETSAGNREGMILETVTTNVSDTFENFDFVVKLMASGNTAAEKFRVASTGAVTFGGMTFPTSDGTNGQVLQTDGSGTLTFASASGVSELNGLTDVKGHASDTTNFSNSLLISTSGSSLSTGILASASNNIILTNNNLSITSASENVVLGNDSFSSATTSQKNVIVGASAGDSMSTGNKNTLIGSETGSSAISSGTLDSNGSSTTEFTLESGQNETEKFYRGFTITFTSGSNNGESQIITDYTTSRVVTVSSAFTGDTPSIGDTYDIQFNAITSATVAIDTDNSFTTTGFKANSTGLSATADLYNNFYIKFDSNTTTAAIRGEISKISSYTALYVFTLETALSGTPASNDTFTILHGNTITTGSENVFVGYNSSGVTSLSNQNSFGFESRCSAANQVTLGNHSVTALRCADTTIASLSDQRDKTNISDSSFGLNFLNSIRPVQYTWNRRHLDIGDSTSVLNGKTRLGFIAQELQNAMSNNENEILDLVYDVNPDRLEAKYGNLIPILTKAVQELSAQNQALTDRITALENA